ncbi:MAG: FAD-dependent oxidoreductase [Gammaproteobacteria bacterium]|nr:FAD-dependent oxidoreductase [Gammaproteobacteria bacterium]
MTDRILVLGGGIAGLTAAMECASAGAHVTVVEHEAIVGGTLAAAMTDESSVADDIDGAAVPKLTRVAAQENIEIITLADLEDIEGRPGNFKTAIRQRARFVTDTCTRCNRCKVVCPSVSANEYDAGLTYRKAIFTPLPQTIPSEFVIDIDSCLNKPPNYLPCNRCIEVCDDDSIHFDLPLEVRHEKHVGAVILAMGCAKADSGNLKEYGYGSHPDIVTTAELQRLLISPGPTGGFVAKPSNEEYPESILLILDELTELAAYTVISQIQQLADQDIERIVLLITTQPEADKPAALQQLPANIDVCWGLLRKIEAGSDNKINVSYADFASSHLPEADYDMVVLCTEFAPPDKLGELAPIIGVDLDGSGYVARPVSETPCASSCPGIYLAGDIGGPVALPETVAQARDAALAALAHLDPRLLREGHAPEQVVEAPGAEPAASKDDVRARIERALYALLNRGG